MNLKTENVRWLLLLLLLFSVCGNTQELCQDKVPKFKKSVPVVTNIQAGQIAYLTCEIYCVNNRSVSWRRERDNHILAVDDELFIQDSRFQSLIQQNQRILMIRSVAAYDAGKYECQVSTHPPLSRIMDLIVVVPKVRIFGSPTIYVEEGSSVQLECVVSQAVEIPKYIVWEFNGEGIGGSTYTQIDKSTTSSTLSLSKLSAGNAGSYNCQPAMLKAATVNIFVLDEEGNSVKGIMSAGGLSKATVLTIYVAAVIFIF